MKLLFPKQNHNVLSPSSYTYISVRDLYISRIGLILLHGIMWIDPGNIYVEIGTAQFPEKECINGIFLAVYSLQSQKESQIVWNIKWRQSFFYMFTEPVCGIYMYCTSKFTLLFLAFFVVKFAWGPHPILKTACKVSVQPIFFFLPVFLWAWAALRAAFSWTRRDICSAQTRSRGPWSGRPWRPSAAASYGRLHPPPPHLKGTYIG